MLCTHLAVDHGASPQLSLSVLQAHEQLARRRSWGHLRKPKKNLVIVSVTESVCSKIPRKLGSCFPWPAADLITLAIWLLGSFQRFRSREKRSPE